MSSLYRMVVGEPCPRFEESPADAWNKRTPVNTNKVHAQPVVNTNKVHAEEPKTKLEVARAALGGHAVEPPPLVDETKTRGRGRPKVHEDRAAYRAEYMRKLRAAKPAG
jgi:hypothetical protein